MQSRSRRGYPSELPAGSSNYPDMAQSSGSLHKKLKTALDETRLLLLGGQILLGFQFHGVFQESFGELSSLARGLDAVALLLMVTTLGLLIAPSMQHRIVEEGRTSQRIFRVTGYMAGAALLPFAISLGIDHYAVVERLFGPAAGYIAGAGFFVLALVFWYGLEYLVRVPGSSSPRPSRSPAAHRRRRLRGGRQDRGNACAGHRRGARGHDRADCALVCPALRAAPKNGGATRRASSPVNTLKSVGLTAGAPRISFEPWTSVGPNSPFNTCLRPQKLVRLARWQ